MSLKDAVYGFAVGDALGVPYEFKERDTFECKGMSGYGTWNQPPGTWSDDTSMLLATCYSIRECGCVDLYNMMCKFVKWAYHGEYTAHGEVFDMGNTTNSAIRNFAEYGIPVPECGLKNEWSNGNGSLMRILPLAYFDGITTNDVINVSKLTHAHDISIDNCMKYVGFCMKFKRGNFDIPSEIANRTREEVKSTTFVIDTLEAALWCVANTDNYKDCVLTAVNLGGDTDTIAAVAGGLAGIKYGYEAIPQKWIATLANKSLIDKCLF